MKGWFWGVMEPRDSGGPAKDVHLGGADVARTWKASRLRATQESRSFESSSS